MPGSPGTARAIAAPSTTGVSSTTVASRLSVTVTTAASTKTPVNSLIADPRLQRADPLGGRLEESGPRAHVGDHQDRDQERDDRRQVPHRACLASLGRDQTGRQRGGDADAGDPDLDPTPRVAERDRQHRAQSQDDDDVGQGRHARSLGSTCEDGLAMGEGQGVEPQSGSVSQQPGRYQRSTSGMVGALLVTLLVILAFVAFRALNRSNLDVKPERVDYLAQVRYAQQAGSEVVYPARLPARLVRHPGDVLARLARHSVRARAVDAHR